MDKAALWTKAEKYNLCLLVKEHGDNWDAVAKEMPIFSDQLERATGDYFTPDICESYFNLLKLLRLKDENMTHDEAVDFLLNQTHKEYKEFLGEWLPQAPRRAQDRLRIIAQLALEHEDRMPTFKEKVKKLKIYERLGLKFISISNSEPEINPKARHTCIIGRKYRQHAVRSARLYHKYIWKDAVKEMPDDSDLLTDSEDEKKAKKSSKSNLKCGDDSDIEVVDLDDSSDSGSYEEEESENSYDEEGSEEFEEDDEKNEEQQLKNEEELENKDEELTNKEEELKNKDEELKSEDERKMEVSESENETSKNQSIDDESLKIKSEKKVEDKKVEEVVREKKIELKISSPNKKIVPENIVQEVEKEAEVEKISSKDLEMSPNSPDITELHEPSPPRRRTRTDSHEKIKSKKPSPIPETESESEKRITRRSQLVSSEPELVLPLPKRIRASRASSSQSISEKNETKSEPESTETQEFPEIKSIREPELEYSEEVVDNLEEIYEAFNLVQDYLTIVDEQLLDVFNKTIKKYPDVASMLTKIEHYEIDSIPELTHKLCSILLHVYFSMHAFHPDPTSLQSSFEHIFYTFEKCEALKLKPPPKDEAKTGSVASGSVVESVVKSDDEVKRGGGGEEEEVESNVEKEDDESSKLKDESLASSPKRTGRSLRKNSVSASGEGGGEGGLEMSSGEIGKRKRGNSISSSASETSTTSDTSRTKTLRSRKTISTTTVLPTPPISAPENQGGSSVQRGRAKSRR